MTERNVLCRADTVCFGYVGRNGPIRSRLRQHHGGSQAVRDQPSSDFPTPPKWSDSGCNQGGHPKGPRHWTLVDSCRRAPGRGSTASGPPKRRTCEHVEWKVGGRGRAPALRARRVAPPRRGRRGARKGSGSVGGRAGRSHRGAQLDAEDDRADGGEHDLRAGERGVSAPGTGRRAPVAPGSKFPRARSIA